LNWFLAAHRGEDIRVWKTAAGPALNDLPVRLGRHPPGVELWVQVYADLAELERAASRPAPEVEVGQELVPLSENP
jgi:hypothetical protein